MRLPSPRFLIGLVLVLVACVAVVVVVTRSRAAEEAARVETVACIGGSEKSALMEDPDLRKLLKDRYKLEVAFTPLGSYDQVQLSKDALAAQGADCLWPSSASAQNVFESIHKGEFTDYRAETLLQSPEVVYAGPQGTDTLVSNKVVARRDDRYYIVDMKRLLLDYVLKGEKWETIGSTLRGPITLASTDAAKSNSGFVLAQLILNIIATSDPFSAPSTEKAREALPTIRALYEAQGLQARSSDQGFTQWLIQGGELQAPLYAGYENQIVQHTLTNPAGSDAVLRDLRILYPEPTIYSDHPMLALSTKAGKLIDAMKDTEVQQLAWKKFGFRSGTQVGLNNVSDFANIPLAQQVRVTKPPNAEVTLLLLACVKNVKACA